MDEYSDTVRRSWFRWYRYVSVEPAMFLYMFAFQLTTVIEQELFVVKSCLSNLNYTHEICDNLNLKENEEFKKNVQVSKIAIQKKFGWIFIRLHFNLRRNMRQHFISGIILLDIFFQL